MIPFNKPALPDLGDVMRIAGSAWATGRVSNFGPLSERLERRVGQIADRTALSCSSCDTGLTLALAALDLEPGSLVLLPSFSFASTLNAVLWNGLYPWFCDIDELTCCLDPQACVASGQRPAAIIATHALGSPANEKRLKAVAEALGAFLVFDAASGLGGSYESGKPIGSGGDIECFSLSPTKPITACEGGVVTFKHEDIADRFRVLRNYGVRDGLPAIKGLNGKLSELHAAVALASLEKLDYFIGERRNIARRYSAILGETAAEFQVEEGKSTCKDFLLKLSTPVKLSDVASSLARNEIAYRRYYVPLHWSGALPDKKRGWMLPSTESVFSRSVCLPMFNGLTLSSQQIVCDAIRKVI